MALCLHVYDISIYTLTRLKYTCMQPCIISSDMDMHVKYKYNVMHMQLHACMHAVVYDVPYIPPTRVLGH